MKNRYTFSRHQHESAIHTASACRNNSYKLLITAILMIAFLLMSGQMWAAIYYSNGNQAPDNVLSWWSNTNGTGTHPATFTNGDVFVIQNGHTMTTSNIWTITGTSGGIVVQGGGTLSVANNVTTVMLNINALGNVYVNSLPTLTITNGASMYDLTVQGTLTVTGSLILMNSVQAKFGSGGVYRHPRNGGSVPVADWDAGSTAEFTGVTSLLPSGISGQSFGNFIWNCVQTTDIQLNGGLPSVKGNFKVQNTGTKTLILTNSASLTLTIGGDFILSSGIVNFANGAATTKVLNLGGNYTQTGGTFNNSNANLLSFNFTGIGKTFSSYSPGILTNTYINWTVNSGASLTLASNFTVAPSRSLQVNGALNCSTFAVSGRGNFNLANAASLILGSPDGISSASRVGNIQSNGTRVFSSSANYTYAVSSGSPVTGNSLPSGINNFTVNNTSGNPLTFSSNALTVSGNMTISNGQLELGYDMQLTVVGTTSLTGAICMVLKSDAYGTSSFISNGSIIGSGTTKVERHVLNNWDWHLLSSPVAAEPIWNTSTKNFVPVPGAGNSWASQTWNWDFYRWAPQGDPNNFLPYPWVNMRDETGIYNSSSYTSAPYGFGGAIPTFRPGTGYLVAYAPDYGLTTLTFSGDLNSGTVNIPLLVGAGTNSNGDAYTNDLNLVGNPYPSAINFDAIASANSAVLASQSYWIMLGDGSYAAYTVGSGGTSGASEYIAPMQGFEVTAASTGNLSITNSTRAHASQQWLKSVEPFANRMSVAVHSNVNNLSDEAIIHFDPSFSTGGGAKKIFSFATTAPNLYTLKNNEKYTINQQNSPENGTEIPVCFVPGISAQYTLDFNGIEGFDTGMPIQLVDLLNSNTTDLRKTASYTFAASPGDAPDRFILRFGLLTGIQESISAELFKITANDRSIRIENYSGAKNFTVSVYDMRGSLLFHENASGSTSSTQAPVADGMYLVKVISDKGTASEKVMIR